VILLGRSVPKGECSLSELASSTRDYYGLSLVLVCVELDPGLPNSVKRRCMLVQEEVCSSLWWVELTSVGYAFWRVSLEVEVGVEYSRVSSSHVWDSG
jgi:hypothetical protein